MHHYRPYAGWAYILFDAVRLRLCRLVILWSCVACMWADAAVARGSNPCLEAARAASAQTGVPLGILEAIARTETGRRQNGKVEPWPWAMNHSGKGYWFETRSELLEAALAQIAKGERLFDLGCFQINYHWHEAAFSSLDEMIAPQSNALYAAEFLKSLFHETGDWAKAAGFYHSRTQELAQAYTQRLANHIDLDAPQTAIAPTAKRAARTNRFPLLQSRAGRPQLGSLVIGISQ